MRIACGLIVAAFCIQATAARPLTEDSDVGKISLLGGGAGHIYAGAETDPTSATDATQFHPVYPEDDQEPPPGPPKPAEKLTLELFSHPSWYGYYACLEVGTPAKEFYLLIDTGSADSWIMSSDDDVEPEEWYKPDEDSKSAEPIPNIGEIKLSYVGDYKGTAGTVLKMYTDTVKLDSLKVVQVPIGAAQSWTEQCDADYGFCGHGIFALGFPENSSSRQTPIFNVLVDRGLMHEPSFSVRLIDPVLADKMKDKSVLTLGGFDPEVLDGSFTEMDVISKFSWIVKADSITVESIYVTHVPVLLDTGCSMILGAPKSVRTFHGLIPGSDEKLVSENDIISFTVPCNSKAVIVIVFKGRPFEIPLVGQPDSYTSDCESVLMATAQPSRFWTLGLPFMHVVYTKFTLARPPHFPAQISFAKSKEPQWLLGKSPAELKSQDGMPK